MIFIALMSIAIQSFRSVCYSRYVILTYLTLNLPSGNGQAGSRSTYRIVRMTAEGKISMWSGPPPEGN